MSRTCAGLPIAQTACQSIENDTHQTRLDTDVDPMVAGRHDGRVVRDDQEEPV